MTAKKTAPSVALADDMVAAKRVAGARASKAVKRASAVAAKARPLSERKPMINEVELDTDFSDVESALDVDGEVAAAAAAKFNPAAAEAKAKPLRVKVPKSKERALIREFGLDVTALTEEEAEKRRSDLKTLVKMGKTRGFLTQQEINDHLPEKLVDAEVFEAIVKMLNDMGIAVYEQAPDAATLLVAGGAGTAATDEEAEEAAEAALSTVDSEFGRTTDPVRMYMREMGSFELLTREGEIEIAKRIEGGLQAMMLAISASPSIMAEILAYADKIAAGEMSISDVVDGFVVAGEADDYVAEEDVDSFDDNEEDDDGGSKAMTKRLEELRVAALDRFASLRVELRQAAQGVREERLRFGRVPQGAAGSQRPADDDPLHRQDDRQAVRHPAFASGGRAPLRARDPQDCGGQVRHAAATLHRALPAQCTEPGVDRGRSDDCHGLQRRPGAQRAGHSGTAEQADRSAVEGRDSARGIEGDQQEDERRRAFVARCQEGNDRGEPAPRDLHREEVHQPRHAVPRPHPGGQRRTDEGASTSSSTAAASSFPPMRPGGFAKRSRGRSPIRPGRSAFRCT